MRMAPRRGKAISNAAAQAQAADDAQTDDGKSSVIPGRERRSDVPTQEQLEKFALPDTYRIKFCKLCDRDSLSTCEYMELGSAWGTLLPWGNGTKTNPTGSYCRMGLNK